MNPSTRETSPPFFDLVGVGESMLALFLESSGSDAFGWDVVGAESNVARYCAALGLRSAWVSLLGSGVAGRLVHDVIAGSGVDTSLVKFREDAPTGLMLRESPGRAPRVQYYRRGSAASRMSPHSFPLDACLNSRIVHLTGITLALSDACRSVVRSLLSSPSEALRSFDVNWRSALWPEGPPRDMLAEIANMADIVFVGLDEAQAIWGHTNPDQVRKTLPEPSYLIVKDGPHGVHTFSEGSVRYEPSLRGPVVQAIGAGDAFAAGFLYGLVTRPDDEQWRQRLGHVLAMSALSSPSDVGRIPEWSVIERMLDANAEQWQTITYPDPPLAAPQKAVRTQAKPSNEH